MVVQLGMAGDLGPRYFGGLGESTLGGRGYDPYEPKEYSDETARRIDAAIAQLLGEAHQRAVDVLAANRAALDAVAAALLREESLDHDQFTEIMKAKQPPQLSPVRNLDPRQPAIV
jgi:cell division protease FtsH